MKAANVLITKAGTLKLADFGLARAFSQRNGQPNRYVGRKHMSIGVLHVERRYYVYSFFFF